MPIKRHRVQRFFVVAFLCILVQSPILAQMDSVTITEIMFNPNGTDSPNEFIEIYNYSFTDTIDLTGWQITDGSNDTDLVISDGEGLILYPGQFAVIHEGDYLFGSGLYDTIIPDTARRVKIDDNVFGSSTGQGLSVSVSEPITLLKPGRITVSIYSYSLGNSDGFSDEKIILNEDNATSNWSNSYFLNGTPGNYPELDLSIKKHRLSFNPISPPTNSAVSISATINNMAIRAVDSFEVKFYEDINRNYNADEGEELDSVSYFTTLSFSDSAMVSVNSPALSSGTHIFIAKLSNISPSDTSLSNNTVIDSVSTVPAMDLSLSTSPLTFTPPNPKVGNNLQISAKFKNTGLLTATAFTIKFYEDINRNVLPEDDEFLDSVDFNGTLNTSDSNEVSITINDVTFGSHSYLAKIISSSVFPFADEVSSNDLRMDSVNVTIPDSITITEVMFDPSGDEGFDEFIEIYNYSSSQTYDLSGWKISDSTGIDNIVNAGEGLLLYPRQFGIILDGDYAANSTTYDALIPDSARIIKAGTNDIGNSGLRNSPPEKLHLITDLNDTISIYRYSGGTASGKSDEKIVLNNDNSNSNWTRSLLTNGTPGNHPELILSINDSPLSFTPAQPSTGNSLQISATVKNIGIAAASSFSVKFYEDTNGNASVEPEEFIDSARYEALLNQNDSVVVNIVIPSISSGVHRYTANIVGNTVLPYPDTAISNHTITDSVETIPAYDAAVRPLLFTPSVPTAGSNVMISTYIRNTGVNLISAIQINFYKDLNADLLGAHEELIDSVIYNGSLIPGDSVQVSVADQVLTRGPHHYIAQIVPDRLQPQTDEKMTNNNTAGTLAVSPPRYSVVINEINYDSANGSTEWIELYNRSSDTLDLKKWTISDGNSDLLNFSATIRTITNNSYTMLPGDYVVVGRDSNIFNTKYGNPAVQKFFISFPNLNNSGDMIGLFDSLGTVIDSLLYDDSWGGGADHSLERIFTDSLSYLASNWRTVYAIGTPGYENSVKPKHFDLSLSGEGILFDPPYPHRDQNFTVTAKVHNIGLSSSGNFTVSVYRRFGNDSLLLSSAHYSDLSPGDSVTIMTDDTAKVGDPTIAVYINYPADEIAHNNHAFRKVLLGAKRFDVVINEIQYLPSASGTEWIELYNRSQDSINIKNWRWADESNYNSPKIITFSDFWMMPAAYAVIAKDSMLFTAKFPNITSKVFYANSNFSSLNNSGDLVFLSDSYGNTVDSLFYESMWGGGTDLSLERIYADSASTNFHNWKSSEAAELATPGKLNSHTPVDFDAAIDKQDIIFTPEHPAVNQSVTITAIIRNKGLQAINTSLVIKTYYDVNNDKIGAFSELIDSVTVSDLSEGDSDIVAFNWTVPPILAKQWSLLAESRFIIVQIEYANDQRTENSIAFRELLIGAPAQSIVINEILYNPDTAQVEFIEIYNPGTVNLNLENWSIGDASTSKILTAAPLNFYSHQYLILTGDSLFFDKFPIVPDTQVIVIASMPSLNNTDDKVILKDDVGDIIDSLSYFSSWGGNSGKSLERRNVELNTNEPSNWVTCVSSERATPGADNSILHIQAYLRNTLIINEIMYSPFVNEPEYIELYNPADTAVNLLNWNIQVGDDKTLIISENFNIPPKDYAVLAHHSSFSDRFQIPDGKILLTETGLPTLSNSGNVILLQDITGSTIDSVDYSPDWGGGEGVSIERIRADNDANSENNWGSCVFIEGGTPGSVNSNIAGSLRRNIKISASPNPFLVDQGEETRITVEIPVTQARMTVKIYDNQGRLINTLLNHSLTGSHREIQWDGKDKNRSFARMGIYIIYVEIIDDATGFSKSAKKTVVLGRKL